MVSRGVNKVIIVGWLGQDLEVCYVFFGVVFVNMIVVILEQW